MNRKKFIINCLVGATGLIALPSFVGSLTGCHDGINSDIQPKTDVLLNDQNLDNIPKLKKQRPALESLVDNLGKEYLIGYQQAGLTKIARLSVVKNSAADYPHVRLVSAEGEVANLLWTTDWLRPAIELTDDQGKTLVKNGQKLIFNFFEAASGLAKPTSTDWFLTGLKIVGIALAVWLGAKVVGAVLSAIAFLAYNLMVLVLLAVAGIVAYKVIKWIADFTGWTWLDVRNFFEASVGYLSQVFGDLLVTIDDWINN